MSSDDTMLTARDHATRAALLSQLSTVLTTAIRQEWTLREFGEYYLEQFCKPSIQANLLALQAHVLALGDGNNDAQTVMGTPRTSGTVQ